METIDLEALERAIQQGHLLHGSPQKLTTIEPRQAHDRRGRVASNQLAVYTTDRIVTAVTHAVVRLRDSSSFLVYSYHEQGGEFHGYNIDLEIGSVYILQRSMFEQIKGSAEYICRSQVEPQGIVRVTPEHLLHLLITNGIRILLWPPARR